MKNSAQYFIFTCFIGMFLFLSVFYRAESFESTFSVSDKSSSQAIVQRSILSEEILLSLLKQVVKDFSTIHSEELTNFKEKQSDLALKEQAVTEIIRSVDPYVKTSIENKLSLNTTDTENQTSSSSTPAKAEQTSEQQGAKPATPVTDSNPEEIYEFDESAAKTPKQRNIEVQNAMADYYNARMREISELQDKANLLAAEFMNNSEKYSSIQSAIELSNQEKSRFENAWFQRNFGIALDAFEKSKLALMKVMFEEIPDSNIEGRAIWLDRGSIIRSGSPEGLRNMIKRIAVSGFNIIYFETINAGYPIYPSRLVEQNPQTVGWDPLAIAVDEAHKHGVELHAWVWVFAVGNTRHNKILGQPDSFPGPILNKNELASEALKGRNGELVLPKQYEYWLSPASFKARSFLTNLFSEIVKNYSVDGLQLDYIRYPFQKPGTTMGFEPFAIARFQAETGLSLDHPNEYTTRAWMAWKAFQVTSFVKELTEILKNIKPELKISAAVFPLARHGRMLMIQQDWETWVRNGWIDTLNPMAYSRSARSLERLVEYIHNISDDKTLVYPGLSLNKLNSVELLDTLEVCRKSGVMGTTLFAVAQFDSDKQILLQTGPYKHKTTAPPHRNPLKSSINMISDTQTIVNGLLKSGQLYPGMETLLEIGESLKSIGTSLDKLVNNNSQSINNAVLISAVRDNSTLLQQRAEQWVQWSDDSVQGFQAKVVKQMVDKVIRMVNYTTFKLSIVKSKT